MKNILFCLIVFISFVSCKNDTSIENSNKAIPELKIAQIVEDNFDLRNDSVIFNSGTIENFDKNEKSIDVYWIGKERDTILRFYRKYDPNDELIGAMYFEKGDTEPSRDTVYTNSEGLTVEASLNAENQISWKSIITTDLSGNPVLKTYRNGKDEYRGLDSLFFDNQNRVIKGFYENSKGKRYSIRTYEYVKSDAQGNWTERKMFKNDTLSQKQVRKLKYYN